MLEKITRFLTGYAEFEVQGNIPRFLNIASKSGYMLWGYRKEGEVLFSTIKASKYKQLHAIKRRTGVQLRCVKKVGIPFYLWRTRKRKGLFVGAVIFVMLYTLLSGGIWDIQISGNENLTEAQIRSAARDIGIYEGAGKNGIDPSEAAIKMHRSIESLSWVSVNTEGNTVVIEVKELEEKPEIYTSEVPSDIVASREGQIISINSEMGMQQVQIGDTVQTGQVLIAGQYDEKETPYVEKRAPKKSYLVAARGSICAETVREFKVEVSVKKPIEKEDELKKNRYLIFFGIKIPLGLNASPNGTYHTYRDVNMLNLLEQELPVGILEENYQFYSFEEKKLSQEEWEQEALFKLRQMQQEQIDGKSTIVEEELKYEYTENTCILTSYCRLEEEIGIKKEILFNYTK